MTTYHSHGIIGKGITVSKSNKRQEDMVFVTMSLMGDMCIRSHRDETMRHIHLTGVLKYS